MSARNWQKRAGCTTPTGYGVCYGPVTPKLKVCNNNMPGRAGGTSMTGRNWKMP